MTPFYVKWTKIGHIRDQKKMLDKIAYFHLRELGLKPLNINTLWDSSC